MTRLRHATLYGAVLGLALIIGADRGFALEPGDFGQTLSGAYIGAPIAAPAPPGLYAALEMFDGPSGRGTGQDLGTTVSVPLWIPTFFWSSGYHILGANLAMELEVPFYQTASYPSSGTTLAGNGSGPPFGDTVWFDTIANTRITPFLLEWSLGNGWFAAPGLTLIVPDGSRYNGTLNPDYFTAEPRLSVAYLSKDWHLTANFLYDINTRSGGHTGTYSLIANTPFPGFGGVPGLGGTPAGPVVASIGNGYTSGQEAFLDVAATYQWGKFEIGPVAAFKWQTTSDSPGGGFTCAEVAALLGPTLGCGKATNISVGGLIGYNFGLVDVQAYATDSVYTKDDYGGWGIFGRLTFKLWGPEAPTNPMPTK